MRHPAALVARWLVLAVLVTVASACGTRAAGHGGPASQPSPSLPTFAATMNPDGTVPWSSAPAINPAQLVKPPRVPPAVGRTCTASGLRGSLPSWISNAASADHESIDPLNAGSLHGYVVLTNTSARPCTLSGVPTVTVLSDGVPIPADYARFGTGNATLVGLPPGGQANFRIDWDAPYCPPRPAKLSSPPPPSDGPFSLRSRLDGLTITITVRSRATPGCISGDPEPHGSRSGVVTSPIEPGVVLPAPAPQRSALRQLTATAESYPGQIAGGQTLPFVIALANPTGRPVSLTVPPPPSYDVFVQCPRTPATPGFQVGAAYSLNTGPRPAVPAHGTIRFAMRFQVPAITCPSHRLTVTWQSPAPGFGLPGPSTSFSIAVD
jgi:hypothetical protein